MAGARIHDRLRRTRSGLRSHWLAVWLVFGATLVGTPADPVLDTFRMTTIVWVSEGVDASGGQLEMQWGFEGTRVKPMTMVTIRKATVVLEASPATPSP